MASFKTQIEDLAGTIPATVDAEAFITSGIWDVINRIEKIAPQMLPLFSAESSWIDGNGKTLTNDFVTSVTRNYIDCKRISEALIAKATDTGSIYYATENSPIFYIINGTLYIKPDPDGSNSGS